MRLTKNEPSASRRRMPVYLVDAGGIDVSGATPTGSQIKVSKGGAAFTNGAGTWTEIAGGAGHYYYTATQSETNTDSFLLLRVAASGAEVVVFSADIGDRIAAREETAAKRRIPIYLVDASGVGVPSLNLGGGNIQTSINGGALSVAAGTWDEIGNGCYYYEAAAAELAAADTFLMVSVNVGGALPFVYVIDVVAANVADDESPEPVPDLVETGNVLEEIDIVAHALSRVTLQFKGTT